ncbi:Glycosyltransferase involved in cell wall bisynthesis [Neorhodopirellula lusitana]|uniref:Glycosyltransferase involved in cell wall bisynthesis n=1 Tax=Neorhodopirellula lusitana TaxID=445327 RepID=A0ABY1PT69_9BACT|nr:glycosyltransferase [Neorhodopirellula lusitana]SMP44191.1 Glycosyltransferase involved in cell wall bisynthesis [Neorhodopirellula lusitana]
MNRRVLFISYAFPPTGGGGVQRAVKFTKYLPQFGWEPTVLTVANPSVPVQDDSLLADVNPNIQIVRARTWEPGYRWKRRFAGSRKSTSEDSIDGSRTAVNWKQSLKGWTRERAMLWMQPDPQVLWNRSAFRVASRVLKRQHHDAVFVTGPPFSSFLLGCDLKRKFGVPLILDFRDEWMLACRYLDNHQHLGDVARRQHAMMLDVLANADAVIATTRASADELGEHCQRAASEVASEVGAGRGVGASVSCIHNGFDPGDIPARSACKANESKRFRLVYTGTLWRLTDIGPFVDAVVRLHELHPELTGRLELVLAGRRTPEQDAVLKPLDRTPVFLLRHDYLPHEEALQLAADADALLLLLSGDEGAERVVPAKLFEYLALKLPVLAICPEGETNELLWKHGREYGLRVDDVVGVANWLAEKIRGLDAGPVECGERDLEPFTRSALTSRLSDVLSGCMDAEQEVR